MPTRRRVAGKGAHADVEAAAFAGWPQGGVVGPVLDTVHGHIDPSGGPHALRSVSFRPPCDLISPRPPGCMAPTGPPKGCTRWHSPQQCHRLSPDMGGLQGARENTPSSVHCRNLPTGRNAATRAAWMMPRGWVGGVAGTGERRSEKWRKGTRGDVQHTFRLCLSDSALRIPKGWLSTRMGGG